MNDDDNDEEEIGVRSKGTMTTQHSKRSRQYLPVTGVNLENLGESHKEINAR